MSEKNELLSMYDVVILGAGKAGLTLALQLRRKDSALNIAVVEKTTFPVPESAHKVGESTVEMGSRYFRQEVGIQGLLQQDHLPKCGLRFFFSAGDNTDITERVELGFFNWPLQPSDQIDRGKFENRLASLLPEENIVLFSGWKVDDIALSEEGHSVTVTKEGEERILTGRWVVDATGRAARLKKKLHLQQKEKHDCSSVWFRVNERIVLDDWGKGNPDWEWSMGIRYLATNHLLGDGYWVWIIPLSSGATSIGIVFDPAFVSFDEVATFEGAMAWLEAHEPQCAEKLRAVKSDHLDFKVMKKYSRATKALFSSSRWALTGEAGAFADPFYSSGADFIAIANTMITDLILRERKGECIKERVEVYNQLFLDVFYSFFDLFRKQYAVMGHAQAMIAKIVWDFSVYWGFVCPLFFQKKIIDPAFVQKMRGSFQKMTHLNKTIQRLFRHWSKFEKHEWKKQFVDYGKIQFMQGLLYNLTVPLDDDEYLQMVEDNLRLLQTVARVFIEYASSRCEKIKEFPSFRLDYAIQPKEAPTDASWVPKHLNTHLSVKEDLERIWLVD